MKHLACKPYHTRTSHILPLDILYHPPSCTNKGGLADAVGSVKTKGWKSDQWQIQSTFCTKECQLHAVRDIALQAKFLFDMQIPLEIAIRETSDSGAPIAASNPRSASAVAYHKIAARLKEKLFDAAATRQPPIFSAE